MSRVHVHERLRQKLMERARAAKPEEACGLLLGRDGRVVDVVQLANDAAVPASEYTLDPLAYMRAERAAERRGLAVVGVWHSHPCGRAVPSETDREAAWPNWVYIIVGHPGDGSCEVRAWRLTGSVFAEEELVE